VERSGDCGQVAVKIGLAVEAGSGQGAAWWCGAFHGFAAEDWINGTCRDANYTSGHGQGRLWFFDDTGYRGQRDTDQQQHCGKGGHSIMPAA
jgi:hypothetical protein